MSLDDRVKTIYRALDIFIAKGRAVELRVPESDVGPQAGLYIDLDAAGETAARISSRVTGVYFPLNPLKKSVNKNAKNCLKKTSIAISDDDVAYRRWLLLDFDPVRASNIPATDEEHEEALGNAKECRATLESLGWPEPVLADSGNGAHLLYKIDLPNDQESYTLIKRVLAALSLRFSTATVTLDAGNVNASRLTRVYGTMNRKGEETEQRPHRRAKLLDVPEQLETVTVDMLTQIGEVLPNSRARTPAGQRFDVSAWLKRYELPVLFDDSWNRADHKWILDRCPWNKSHRKSAFVVQFADGAVAAGCLHNSCSGKNWPQLRNLFEDDAGDGGDIQKRSTLTSQLIQTVSPNLSLFQTPEGEAYAGVTFAGHTENHAVESNGFRQYLEYSYFRSTGGAAQPRAVNEATSYFAAVARFDSPTESVFLRVGYTGEAYCLDLANERWEAIEFSKDGWRVARTPRVRFRRVDGMLPLPTPAVKCDINDLREFLNIRNDQDWLLFITHLVNSILPDRPYTILGFHGEAGSAKSTAAKVVRRMTDPNGSPLRAMPRDIRDLMVMARSNWALCFDNLSFLPVWFSDCLCRLSTGGGFSTRSLFTNADEFIFDGQRPIVLNGIEELVTRTDLLDRSVLIELPVLRKFRDEAEFWKKFDSAHPGLLAALLDLTVTALEKLPNIKDTGTQRMAGFARVGIAVEAALGLQPGSFIRAYTQNRKNATTVALESSPIAAPVCRLADNGWEGTATKLLAELSTMTSDEIRTRRSWPKNPTVLSGMLRRLATGLRTVGVELEFDRDDSPKRNRIIRIERLKRKAKKT